MRAWRRTSALAFTWASDRLFEKEAPPGFGRRRVRASAWPALLVVLVGLTLLPSCFRVRGLFDGGRQPIVDVQIVHEAEKRRQAAAPIDDEDLKPTILEMMDDWSDFAFRRAGPQEAGWQLTIRIAQLTERTADPATPDVKARSAGISIDLRALDAVEGERPRYAADQLLTRTEPQSVPIVRLVQDTLRKAGQRLMRFREVQRADDDGVVAALRDEDPTVRAIAVQTAGSRKIRAAVPILVERLKATDEPGTSIVSIVGALVEMNATEATSAIIDTARQQDRSYIVPLLYALAQLGGRQAQAYLFTVQSGHPDPVVKQAAAEALRELESRDDEQR